MKRFCSILAAVLILILVSSNPIAAANDRGNESVADFFNRIYGDVFLYTSRNALENRLHEMESTLRGIHMVDGANAAAEVQFGFRSSVMEERVEHVLKVATTLDTLYRAYTSALLTTDLDYILITQGDLQNFLLQMEISIHFNAGILEQVFAPIFIDLPPGDVDYLEARIHQLRAEIQMTAEYDLGNIPDRFPTAGRITSHFGFRSDPFTGQPAWHSGIDIGAPEGTAVYAWFSGDVRFAGREGNWGLQVTTVQDSVMVRYAHLSVVYVNSGERVEQGDLIGRVGSTGRSTAPHLHLGLYLNNVAVNPYFIISRR